MHPESRHESSPNAIDLVCDEVDSALKFHYWMTSPLPVFGGDLPLKRFRKVEGGEITQLLRRRFNEKIDRLYAAWLIYFCARIFYRYRPLGRIGLDQGGERGARAAEYVTAFSSNDLDDIGRLQRFVSGDV
jgi:hypothetical protein